MQSIFYPNSLRKTRETISECNLFYFHRSECFAEAKSRGPKRTFRVASSALWAANREENQNRHSKECGIIQNLILSSDTVSTRFGISICVLYTFPPKSSSDQSVARTSLANRTALWPDRKRIFKFFSKGNDRLSRLIFFLV